MFITKYVLHRINVKQNREAHSGHLSMYLELITNMFCPLIDDIDLHFVMHYTHDHRRNLKFNFKGFVGVDKSRLH
jgi:hypothetical protein